jgi:hypothetical protein
MRAIDITVALIMDLLKVFVCEEPVDHRDTRNPPIHLLKTRGLEYQVSSVLEFTT